MSEKKRKLSEILAEKAERFTVSQKNLFLHVFAEHKDAIIAALHERAEAGFRSLIIRSDDESGKRFAKLFAATETYVKLYHLCVSEAEIGKKLSEILEVEVRFAFGRNDDDRVDFSKQKTFQFSW